MNEAMRCLNCGDRIAETGARHAVPKNTGDTSLMNARYWRKTSRVTRLLGTLHGDSSGRTQGELSYHYDCQSRRKESYHRGGTEASY